MKNDLIVKITVVFLITVGVVFWVLNYLFLSPNTARKSKASADVVDISYDNASPSVSKGSDLTTFVRIKPSSDISLRGYTLRLKFDKSILQVKYIDYKLGVPSTDFADTSGTLSTINQTGVINLQGEIQNSSPLIISSASTTDLVRLVFTAISATGTTVTGDNSSFYTQSSDGTITTNLISTVPNLNINGGQAAATCSGFADGFSSTTIDPNNWNQWTNNNGGIVVGTGEATLYLPASADGTTKGTSLDSFKHGSITGGDFSTEITLKSINVATGKKVAGSLLAFSANTNDGRYVQIQRHSDDTKLYGEMSTSSTTYTVESKDIGLTNTTPVRVKIERTGTTIKMYYDIFDGKGYQLLRQIDNFADMGASRVFFATYNYAPDYPQSSAKFSNFILTCGAGATPIPTVTGVTGNTILNLKLKFQGITGKPADSLNNMKVKVTLAGGPLTSPVSSTGTFTGDANGVWSGAVGFDLSSYTGKFTIYVKGPRHLQKKICDATPTESSAGTYNCADGTIILKSGQNNFDFSNIIMLSGDVTGPSNAQDGLVSAVDLSYIRNKLNSTDSTCDVDLDGKCTTRDYSLVISSLLVKTDQL